MISIANAPVSYGVFGLARPDLVALPSGHELLRLVAEAGYQGVDLGAHGLFGTGPDLVANLHRFGLGLAGGWLDFPFASDDDDEFEEAFRASAPVLDDFALVAEQQQTLPNPLPTIADAGDAARKARPGERLSSSSAASGGTVSWHGWSEWLPMSVRWASSPPSTTTQ